MNYESYKYLRIERDAGIATLTLNQPDNRNAIHAEMHAELEKVWLELAEDKEVNVIVFTGAGKFFSAGGDIKRMASRWGTDEGWRFSLEVPAATRRMFQNILEVSQPIICAVNGDAVGWGATLALFSDRAKEFLMRGRLVSGAEAHQLNLVNHQAPADQVMDKAMEIARELAAMPPLAVRWTKLSVNKWLKQQLNLVLDASIAYEMLSMNSKDHHEAAMAFIEKRKPEFKGL